MKYIITVKFGIYELEKWHVYNEKQLLESLTIIIRELMQEDIIVTIEMCEMDEREDQIVAIERS